MAEPHRVRLHEQLARLAGDVGADGGASLYLDDGDGVLEQVASTLPPKVEPRGLLRRLRGVGGGRCGTSLLLSVPDKDGGVLLLERTSADQFSHEDRAVARLHARRLVDEVAVAGRQVRSSVWTRQLETVQRVAARLTRLASLDEVGAAICAETTRVIDFDEAHVLVLDAAHNPRTVASAGAPLDPADQPRQLPSQGAGGRAIASALLNPRPLLLTEVRDLGPGREGDWSLLLAPMHYEGRSSGVICLLKRGLARFDDSHQRVLHILADQAAVAVENARLLAGRNALVEELAVLLEISKVTAEAASERQLGNRLAALMCGALKMDACVIWHRDENSTLLRILGRSGKEGPDLLAEGDALSSHGAVLTDGVARVVRADDLDNVERAQALAALGGDTLLLLPLRTSGPPIGLVELISFRPRQLSEAEMSYVQTMCSLASTGLERARLIEQLRQAADIDPLTNVNNNRYLRTRLRQEVARAARSNAPLSVLMLDLDDFKPVNDLHGHSEGDQVLARIAGTIKTHVRTADIVARYGGDEFVVVMPDTDLDRARVVARRVVRGIKGERHRMANGSEVRIGVSAGLAHYPQDGRTAAALLNAADAQMYSAKRGARSSRRAQARPTERAAG
jgi:diguanylate cyclase (GGDEF)-like protein